jgi:cytochrome c oxidase subunit 2
MFLIVPMLGVAAYAMAAFGIPPLDNCWLPENYSIAGRTIDHLWNVTHWIAAVVFVLTGLVLGGAIWRYGRLQNNRAAFFHQHIGLEIVLSLIAAAILVFLAFYQMRSWAENKMLRPMINVDGREIPRPPLVKVVAKRFGWEFFHAGPDGKLDTRDDIYVENRLIAPHSEDIVLQLESLDVIHSLFVPGLRLKQDIVPGLVQTVWFHATQSVELEIVCAELCGWGHYTMQGRLQLVSRAEYDAWILEQLERRDSVVIETDQ